MTDHPKKKKSRSAGTALLFWVFQDLVSIGWGYLNMLVILLSSVVPLFYGYPERIQHSKYRFQDYDQAE